MRLHRSIVQPRFHSSFAWVLLDHPTQCSPDQAPEPPDTTTLSEDLTSDGTNTFPTIQCLPENIVPASNAELDSQFEGTSACSMWER